MSTAATRKLYRDKHPDRVKASQRKYERENPEKVRESRKRTYVKGRYGITVEQYDKFMKAGCGICGAESTHLDHCHTTGKIRGGLCSRHNIGLGHFKDDPAELISALKYLLGG